MQIRDGVRGFLRTGARPSSGAATFKPAHDFDFSNASLSSGERGQSRLFELFSSLSSAGAPDCVLAMRMGSWVWERRSTRLGECQFELQRVDLKPVLCLSRPINLGTLHGRKIGEQVDLVELRVARAVGIEEIDEVDAGSTTTSERVRFGAEGNAIVDFAVESAGDGAVWRCRGSDAEVEMHFLVSLAGFQDFILAVL